MQTICSLLGTVITAVLEPAQLAAAPLEVGRADIIEHQRAVLEMALGQPVLDALLVRQ